MNKLFFLFAFFPLLLASISLGNADPIPISNLDKLHGANSERTFKIDKGRNIFLKDGQPFRYIAGEINYFRIHKDNWEDRLRKVRAAGLNAISVYLPWMIHEPTPDSFDFSGQNNFTEFILLAQKLELFTFLRIGPYVCAELEFGGLPWWLNKHQKMELRTTDAEYLGSVRRYFDVLLPIVRPLLYQNGGPVLMVQVENEYGFRKLAINESCDGFDRKYLENLRDQIKGHFGENVVLYSTDPDYVRMKCSHIDGVHSTPDFGIQENEQKVLERFGWQRELNGGGPFVNSEFYTTWFTWWSNPKEVLPNLEGVKRTMDWMWNANASFSFYMIHGGSNFDFLAGNKHDWIFGTKEGPVAQSYDYAAPIDEAGQITPLYEMIREWIKERPNWPNKPWDLPSKQSGAKIENINGMRMNLLEMVNKIVDSNSASCIHHRELPLNIEQLDREYPLTIYSTILTDSGHSIEIPGLADHGYVYLDGIYQGNLTNVFSGSFTKKLEINGLEAKKGQNLEIIVEHIGRLLFPLAELDHKGILSQVLLDGRPIQGEWQLCGIDVHKLNMAAQKQIESMKMGDLSKNDANLQSSPSIYVAQFSIEEPTNWSKLHTFFDTRGWGHGILVVNDFVVGRYWPVIGPQMSLFVPGPTMKQRDNFVALIELSGREKEDTLMEFVPNAIWEYSSRHKMAVPPQPRKMKKRS